MLKKKGKKETFFYLCFEGLSTGKNNTIVFNNLFAYTSNWGTMLIGITLMSLTVSHLSLRLRGMCFGRNYLNPFGSPVTIVYNIGNAIFFPRNNHIFNPKTLSNLCHSRTHLFTIKIT